MLKNHPSLYRSEDNTSESFGPSAKGAISSLSRKKFKQFLASIVGNRKNLKNLEWSPEVKQLRDLIAEDITLKMNWEQGFASCNKVMSVNNTNEVLDMIDTSCKVPPAFADCDFIGFPINAIFLEFMQNQNGRAFFSNPQVNKVLKKILNSYAAMLNLPESVKYLTDQPKLGWFSQQAEKQIHNDWFKCDSNLSHYGYKCWNDWFVREFKDGLRPICAGTPAGISQQDVIVNSCESLPLKNPIQPQRYIKFNDKFWLKDNLYSLVDIFGGPKHKREHYASHFTGGTIYQAYLNAFLYHRWHAPVDGTIEDIIQIDGTYYLDQSQFIPFDSSSQTNSQSFLSAVATRKIVVIRAKNPKIGKIAIVYIGMAEVSCCVATVEVGQEVKKGEQLGYFQYGGSSHLMIFEKDLNIQFKRQGVYEFNSESRTCESCIQQVNSYLAHVTH